MSRGLGKWERFVMDAVTYLGYDKLHDEYFLHSYGIPDLVALYQSAGHGYTDFETLDDIATIKFYKDLNAKEKSIYQSITRSIRSLERKGFIKSKIEPPDPLLKQDMAEDGITVKDHKIVEFNVKCLAKGIPWQLKYLNKRLVKIKRGEYA